MDPAISGLSAPSRSWAPIPGPVDRVSFFEEQRRHRRSTWRLTALCVAAVLAMGLVVSCIVGPLVLAQLTFLTEVLGIFLPVPGIFKAVLLGYWDVVEVAMKGLDGEKVAPLGFALGIGAALLPGVGLMMAIWLSLRSLFLRDGVGAVLLSIGAREPRPGDLEERQLVNVVAEMAIAAGLQPPRVVVLDSDVPNAAVVGSSAENATLVVPRRLLDEFDRDQTQGILGHLIGSIGNGDLRIAFSIVSVYQTFGLLMTLLDAPFSAEARANALQMLRYALRPGRAGAEDVELASRLLGRSLGDARLEEIGKFIEPDPDSALGRLDRRLIIFRGIRAALFMPLLFANLFGKLALLFFMPLLIGPLIALVWRSRRYLADATAVQLTRNPDGLGEALIELIEKGGLPPGGRWASHLFVVGTEVAKARAQRDYRKYIEGLRRHRGQRLSLDRVASTARGVMAAGQQYQQASEAAEGGTFAEESSIFVNFHPPLDKRLKRLRAQGATIAL